MTKPTALDRAKKAVAALSATVLGGSDKAVAMIRLVGRGEPSPTDTPASLIFAPGTIYLGLCGAPERGDRDIFGLRVQAQNGEILRVLIWKDTRDAT